MAAYKPGHSFRDIRVEGNSRAHLGDVYQFSQESPLSRLPYAQGASFNSSRGDPDKEAECLSGTREEVLDEIYKWADGPSQACAFWLSGMAGRGKSTIARTIARTYHKKKRLGASFFFSKGSSDVSQPAKFFTTLALQLALSCPLLKPAITRAVEQNENVGNETLRDQWNQLILGPLSSLHPERSSILPPLIVVVDALDECEGDHGIREILRVLPEAKTLTTVRLRILVTSRPETIIQRGFRAMRGAVYEQLSLDRVRRDDVDEDISRFLENRFEDIVLDFEDLPPNWPGKTTINLLVQKAAGLFIYAATVCRFIQRNDLWHPKQLLTNFVPDEQSEGQPARKRRLPAASPTAELDALYMTVLGQSMAGIETAEDMEELAQYFKLVLGSLVSLSEPLSTTALANLLDEDERTLHTRLRRLRSVLYVPEDPDEPIQLLHPSFRDFLTSEKKCCDDNFHVDHATAHQILSEYCLGRLMHCEIGLRKDICDLALPGTLREEVPSSLITDHIPSDMRYACVYWAHHLKAANILPQEDGSVHQFLTTHFLHWLEALSLLDRYHDGVMSLLYLKSVVTPAQSPRMSEFVQDAVRFIRYGRYIIEMAPLQAYCSALVFCPENSIVRKQFLDQIPSWITRLPRVDRDWNPCLQVVLEGHTDIVRAVAFSPDGRIVASGSEDHTVKLWDPVTGTLNFTLRSHSRWVTAVAFSPNNRLLASASRDGIINLWDPGDGTLRRTLRETPPKDARICGLFAICFSRDGRILAAAFDMTIILWNPDTWTPYRYLDAGAVLPDRNVDCIISLSFSPDGKLLASVTSTGRGLLWDCATGRMHKPLWDGSNIRYAAFSPVDSTMIAMVPWRFRGRVSLWDVNQELTRHTMGHGYGDVATVEFSPDGSVLATATWGSIHSNDVYLWDSGSGTSLGVLRGHDSPISSLAFSPDGKLIAYVSRGSEIGLLDSVVRVGVSPDGPNPSHPESDDHSDLITDRAFSPCGRMLASGSLDETVKLWDPATGRCFATLAGHSYPVCALGFSPNGRLLASKSQDGTVIVWGVAKPSESESPSRQPIPAPTGATLLYTLQCPDENLFAKPFAFSPDFRLLASGTHDGTVIVREVAKPPESESPSRQPILSLTGPTLLRTLQCPNPPAIVTAVALSPDSRLLAANYYGASVRTDRQKSRIRLWEVGTGRQLLEADVEVDRGYVKRLSFDPKGSYLQTEWGIVEFPQPFLYEPTEQTGHPLPAQPSLRINMRSNWVSYDDQRALWLPEEIRRGLLYVPACIWADGDESAPPGREILVLSDTSNRRCVFMEFDLSAWPHRPARTQ